MDDEQVNTIVNHEIDLEDSHPRGEKPKYFGELIEQDGSIHQWFGNTVPVVEKVYYHMFPQKRKHTVNILNTLV